ncbi:MAG: BrnT family toxin [Pyrinomonadaceae bacterium]
MNFEWDSTKNDENVRRHFLDFENAWEVFEGPMLTSIDDRFDYDEVRNKAIGFLRDLVVVLIFNERDDDIIRVISLRKATRNERNEFYKFLENRLGAIEDNV